MSQADEGFLARWSRRKAGGKAPDEAPPAPLAERPGPPVEALPAAHQATPSAADPAAPAIAPLAEPVPLPTMDDVAALTRSSDYARFVQPGVGRDVSNAAMKKLFSDPHFNVMDGLDTYIADYGKADPIPPAMLRLMNQAVSLGLFDDDPSGEKPGPGTGPALACPDGGAGVPMAQSDASPNSTASPSATPFPSPVPEPAPDLATDDDPDLRLQPDDAPGRRGAEPGPRA